METRLPILASDLNVACIQLSATENFQQNIDSAEKLIRIAAAKGANFILLPEKWNALGNRDVLLHAAKHYHDETIEFCKQLAKDLNIYLHLGSIIALRDDSNMLANRSYVFDPSGDVVADYEKLHMFDVEVGGVKYLESEVTSAGAATSSFTLSGIAVGLTICFDLRFPELFRKLALDGAQVIVVPAAFTMTTGRDHWETLLRARAIENQVYIVAANVVGKHDGNKESYGRSMIIDPWGTVIAKASDYECVISGDISIEYLQKIRANLPTLTAFRSDLF